jgi:hypothetical protein
VKHLPPGNMGSLDRRDLAAPDDHGSPMILQGSHTPDAVRAHVHDKRSDKPAICARKDRRSERRHPRPSRQQTGL